jgi:O-antigen/teichoic acid export membrane protein
VDFIATGASGVLMVKMAERSNDAARGPSLELWHEAVHRLALLLLPVLAVLLVVGRDLIVFLFTERFRASVPVFMVFTLTIGLAVLPTDSALRAYRQTGALLGLNVLRLFVVAASILPLLAAFGLSGAALSVVLGALAFKLAGLVRIGRLLEAPVRRLLPWRDLAGTLGVTGTASAAAWLAKETLSSSLFGRLAVAGVVFSVVYVGGALLIGAVQADAPAQPAV